jgi:hypothetical protein
VAKINPLLEEFELNEKVNYLLQFEEIPHIFKDSKLKEARLKKIDEMLKEVENSCITYEKKSLMLQKIYGGRFVLGLKEGNDYLQLLASGGLGFVFGFLANDGIRNYFNKLAKEFASNIQYAKS